MDKLILHGGAHKTGSSAVQEILARELNDPGFDYVMLRIPNGSRAIGQAFDRRLVTWAAGRGKTMDEQERDRIREWARKDIADTLSEVKATTGLLSAERLIRLERDDIKDMLDLFSQFARRIEFVAYIRDLRGFAESAFQQRLRMFMDDYRQKRFRMKAAKWVAPYDEFLGADRVKLWKYDPGKFASGDVTVDFCQRIGAQIDPARCQRHNSSLSLEALKLLWVYRTVEPRQKPGDAEIIHALRGLAGDKLRFGEALLADLSDVDVAQIRVIEDRIGAPLLDADFESDPGNLHKLSEMNELSKTALEWLGQRTGTAGRALSTTEDIVAALRKLGG